MKKMKANVNENDRVMINIIDREKIQYILVDAKSGEETKLGDPIKFSLSVKKYFGVHGKTIRDLYGFKSWNNKKLETEIKRIWRAIDKVNVIQKQLVVAYRSYNDDRAA